MTYKTIVFIVLIAFAGTLTYGADKFEDKIKYVSEQKNRRATVELNDNLRKEIDDFLVGNEGISAKDFTKIRLAGSSSLIILEELGKKYHLKDGDYQTKIHNEYDKKMFKIADKIFKKYRYREFYTCKNDDDIAAMDSMKKVNAIRTQVSTILKKDTKKWNSDEVINLEEQIISECRFAHASLSLLSSYRVRGMREKYNNLMIRIIEDDQVNYDYLYGGIDAIDASFVLQYLHFLKDVNGRHQKLILSHDQVTTIAESLLTKHQEIFNMRNAPYYAEDEGIYLEDMVSQGVQSMVIVSNWLREYQLDDLNNRFIDRFLKDDMVISMLRADPWFKDYWKYLQSRQSGTVKQ